MSQPAADTDMILHWARGYDALVWVLTLGKERRFRDNLVELAALAPGESVLDVGCGTGSLAMAAKARVGAAGEVAGVDASPEMVARARRKAAKAGLDIRFETSTVETLPFPDASFDAVLATLMLHHLTDEGRAAGLREIARVLKPGGRFLAVDIGRGKGHAHSRLPGRFKRHAEFDLDTMAPVLEHAGLGVAARGPVQIRVVGMANLRFLRAEVPST